MSIVINTPNGNIGRPLVLKLLEAGRPVVLISRGADKVADLVAQGARLVEGSIDEPQVLRRALEGAEALFWLTPPAYTPTFFDWVRTTTQAAAQAVKEHGVRRVVVLSSAGAQSGPGSGPVGVLREVEEAFKAAAPDVTVLRPGLFMENLLRSVDSLTQAGAIFMPLPADKKMPLVATADIAAKAAEVLLDSGWTGHRYLGVHGPEDLSHNEVASILGEVLGRPVRYVQVTVDDARSAMKGLGMPGFLVDLFGEMYEAILQGRLDPAEPRTAETTTPTPLAHFARTVLAPALGKAA